METVERQSAPVRQHRLHWWKEALIVAVFYVIYSWTRNQFGSNQIAADGIPEQAFTNAERIIRLEQWMGLYHEPTVQDWFLPYTTFIQFWNVYYGTAHFFVTIGVFILLFVKRKDVFAQWRNTLAAMTALAIIGFAWFPLMPPRLLDKPCPMPEPGVVVQDFVVEDHEEGAFGGKCIESDLRGEDGTFGFVDTLAEFGGPWSFDSETVASISNQYAAMPSLHIGWSTWCAIAVWPLLRRRWTKVVVLLYPALTLFCIVVTANHYWVDGVGGILVFGVGAAIGWGLHRWNQDRLDRKFARSLPSGTPSAIDDTHIGTRTEAPVDARAEAPAGAGADNADPGPDPDADADRASTTSAGPAPADGRPTGTRSGRSDRRDDDSAVSRLHAD